MAKLCISFVMLLEGGEGEGMEGVLVGGVPGPKDDPVSSLSLPAPVNAAAWC